MFHQITSADNPKIKKLLRYRQENKRKKSGLIIIEGQREIALAIRAGLEIVEFYFAPGLARQDDYNLLESVREEKINEVPDNLFGSFSRRENPDGFLALAEAPARSLSDLKLSDQPLVLVLEGLEKPGNLGAILRTADAAGVEAVILADSRIDMYNANAIRSSQGTVFTVPCVSSGNEEVLAWLKANKLAIFSTFVTAKETYFDLDFRQAGAIVLGAEDKGVTSFWQTAADKLVRVPMQGAIDSLNVSVCAAVLVFEAVRQREGNSEPRDY